MLFTQGLHRAVQQRPDAIATICAGREQSFSVLYSRVARLAAALHALGIRGGNSVAMLGLNSDRYLEYLLAVPWTGAQVNPVNFRWSLEEIIFSLRDSESVAIFIDENFSHHVGALLDACPYVRQVIYCGQGTAPPETRHVEDLIAEHPPMADACLKESPEGGETYGIFYTGGTTGTPKGVLLSHRAVCTSALSLMAEGLFPEGVVGLHVAPMFHLADMMLTTCLLLRGGTHVMLPAFKPDAVLKAIQDHRVTDVLMVPAMMQALVDWPEIGSYDLSSLRNFLYGASPASEALLERAMGRLPGVCFYQGYGMTEVAAVACVLGPSQHGPEARAKGRLRAAGRPACHVQVRIAGTSGEAAPAGQVGEILLRGPNLMQGYWRKPAATTEALRDGWMHSGDIGYLDPEGYVYIVDRAKDMIISGGENIYSVEVENAIARHPSVAACAVIGVPCEALGERVHAVVVLKPGAELTIADLSEHCKALIAGYKCPRALETREALPISGAGKVLKTELRKPYWEGRARTVN